MSDSSEQPDVQASAALTVLVDELMQQLSFLKSGDLVPNPETAQKVIGALAILIELLKRIDQTVVSQLEVLGKNHTQVKAMAETLKSQGLLNVEAAVRAVLDSRSTRMTRLVNYSDLLLRWWSAILAGVQSSILEVPHELTEALNPANWNVEMKRWASEHEAYWNHYRYVIKPETPLKVGDRMKTMQADKTLEAYAILGGDKKKST